MAFTLESGIPIPKSSRGRATGSKYPFALMEVGESFLVATGVKAGTIRSALGAFNKRNPDTGKFAVRETEEGVRVWRTA